MYVDVYVIRLPVHKPWLSYWLDIVYALLLTHVLQEMLDLCWMYILSNACIYVYSLLTICACSRCVYSLLTICACSRCVYSLLTICACSRCVRLSELICIQNVNCVCLSHKYIHCTSIRCKLLFLLFMQKGTYIYIYTAIFLAYFFVNKNENVKLVETVLCSYLCLVWKYVIALKHPHVCLYIVLCMYNLHPNFESVPSAWFNLIYAVFNLFDDEIHNSCD